MSTLELFKQYKESKHKFLKEMGAENIWTDIEDHTTEFFSTNKYELHYDDEIFNKTDDGDYKEAGYITQVAHGGIWRKNGLVLIQVRDNGENFAMLFDESKELPYYSE